MSENLRNKEQVSTTSNEFVIAMVGFAGAGTSTAAKRIATLIGQPYKTHRIKFSDLIARLDGKEAPQVNEGADEGKESFARASEFQNSGDEVRANYGDFALAAAAIAEIKKLRSDNNPGQEKIAYILDSIKHPSEIELLREVYEHSFRLVAVHCSQEKRLDRISGPQGSTSKYAGVPIEKVKAFMSRDAKDRGNKSGQSVIDAFHQADFFLDNSSEGQDGAGMTQDINRFLSLILGKGLVRPNSAEKAIYIAHASALQSSCLSRQVGAALVSESGQIISTGKNDPPAFGGGTYSEGSKPDHRCFKWKFTKDDVEFVGCHNDRSKAELYAKLSRWMADNLSQPIAGELIPENVILSGDMAEDDRARLAENLKEAFPKLSERLAEAPGIRDAIEYSRAIHAEMATLLEAAREGISTRNSSMFVTVFPCHNCARHLVAAGVKKVEFIEPYDKSLAYELHSDAIAGDSPSAGSDDGRHMVIRPFTGVGPRMYDDFFVKRLKLKKKSGEYHRQKGGSPVYAVRLKELEEVERSAMQLVPKLEQE
ncbi:anti-phage dCTP deaminase [Citromicrobium bathyomarinum]|uniref:anti-phage dCTP deaminase n=1 Tax=Citromicrobium bathyomarinum TaxID=72174 RepID=UPI00315B2A6E